MYLGDYAAGVTIYLKFTTYQPSTGAAFTLGGTPAVSVYKDNSTTQSTAGVTLTASFDSVTGLNHVTIDTSADGTFYSAGSTFSVVITTGTVDSVSVVGSVVAQFTLGRSAAFGRLGAPAGASIAADIAAIEAQTDDIGAAGAGLTAVPWNSAWDAEVQSEVADALAVYDPPTNAEMEARTIASASYATAAALATVDGNVDAILEDTGTTLPATLSTIAGYLDTEIAAIKAVTDNLPDSGALTSLATASALATVDSNVDAILADTGTDGVIVASLAAQAKADVNAEVLDVLNTDTFAEPGQGAPGATITLAAKIGYLYKAFRNKSTQTSDTYTLFADDASTADQKATVSDDGTTLTRGEITTGA